MSGLASDIMSKTGIHPTSGLRLAGLILGLSLGAGTAFGQTAFRGTWADAFHVGYKSAAQIDQMIAYALQGNYNAVIVEVMAYQDAGGSGYGGHGAYWNSDIIPKAQDVPSTFDPLGYLCQQAHEQGLEVHAWLVTYRVCEAWPPAGNAIVSAHPEWMMVPGASIGSGPAPVGTDYVLDPGSPEVQDYLISIVRELVSHYPIDGINWDYIRYTQQDAGYPADTNYYYSSLKRFQRIYNRGDVPAYTDSSWSDFRRRTIDELVRRCRAEIPGMPSSRQPLRLTADVLAAGGYSGNFTSSTAYLYFQNWKYWMDMAWLDAVVPMNYKREHCPNEATMYRQWVDAAISWRNGRHVYAGQAGYLNSMANSITQLSYAYTKGANGTASYSYVGTRAVEDICDGSDAWVTDWAWYSYVAQNLFTTAAATPGMPWRSAATATEGTIWGQISNSATGLPVDDATVTISGKTSRTDANGYYVVTLLGANANGTPYTIYASKSGLPSTNRPSSLAVAGEVRRYDITLGAGASRIAVNGGESPVTLTRQIRLPQNLANDTFTVSALNWPTYGPVNYLITDNAAWLSVSPTHGSTTGEADTITVAYSTATLEAGEHTATITVSDSSAGNSPRTLTVNLTVLPPPIPTDFDDDGDVDQFDFARMQRCLSGASVPQNDPDCQNAKLDADSDADQDDMRLFLGCMTGPGLAGDPDCLAP